MANSNRYFMSSPRFYVEKERTSNDISDYRYHKDYSGRHSIADLSLTSYRPYERERQGRYGSRSERRFHRSRSRSRSSSRSSSSSRTRTSRSRSHHSHARSSRHHSSRHGDRHHQRHHRHHRSDSISSSSSSDSLSSLTIASPPQFVTPVHEFERSEKEDLEIKIGDVIEVKRYVDKNWYKGTNLSTRKKGIFPIAYVKEVEVSSTKVVEQLSGRRAVSQSRVSEKLLVELPKETERKGSFFYPSDTVIVRDRGNRVTSTGYREIDQDVILIRPKDTINNESAKIVRPTAEREVVEEDVTIIQPRRTIEAPVIKDEKIIIPIRRKEIPYSEVSKYANSGPEVDIERLRLSSRHRDSEERYVIERPKETKDVLVRPKEIVVEKPVVVERPREVVIERPREIEEASTVISQGGRSRARSIKEIRLDRGISYSPPARKKEFKMLPPPQTITYNEYGAPVFVDTKTFAPAPIMSVPPRPHYAPRALEPAPVPVLPQSLPRTRVQHAYQY
ncbi:hypothetical protein TWF569_008797 [Orbilia oligospora]|nr:hypothetical protein TWF706_007533 [Orbilia oligospora]KAF3138297.1 hypothetical protein TWF569_008797 [Orbilia oligospora]